MSPSLLPQDRYRSFSLAFAAAVVVTDAHAAILEGIRVRSTDG